MSHMGCCIARRVLTFWLVASGITSAFLPPIQQHLVFHRTSSTLQAIPPTFIITPILKKMREDKEKKNTPMYDEGEADMEAPGLRVGRRIWKWPAIWPYDEAIFKAWREAEALANEQRSSALASMLTGAPQITPDQEKIEKLQSIKFDAMKYWGEEAANVTVPLTEATAKRLQSHFAFYLKDGMSVLEFGAAEKSYLPKDLKLSRHVGVGANLQQMKNNPSLTETMVVDLNNVVPDRDVDSDDLRILAKNPFDAIIMTDTVGFLSNPREVFRTAWYLLKPGGRMIVAFSGRDFMAGKYTDSQTAIWRQYNDDQHMWITGSFFHFSAGDGWENLTGFDISPETAKRINDGPLEKLMKFKSDGPMYVVQATKGYQDNCIDMDNIERSVNSLCWMLPGMESRDKRLVVPRLTRALETSTDPSLKTTVERNIQYLPAIYETLIKMDTFAFTFAMQSQLATELVCDPDFTANNEQIQSLKEGLGLRSPGADFWKPVGMNTAAIGIEDKISLLSYIVPRFGSNDPAQEEALQAFATGLTPVYAVLRSKCPTWSEADIQLVGSELLAIEILKPGYSSREEFAVWVGMLSADELDELLALRKALRVDAKSDLDVYREAREKERQRIEALREKMQQQIETARMERSMFFNPRTQKMEKFDNPQKK